MALSPVIRMQLLNQVERVLHAPGNPTHDLKEMTLVLDYHMEKSCAETLAKDVVGALKSHSKVFANVRCNLVHWKHDEEIYNEIMPLPMIQMGKFAVDYKAVDMSKRGEILCDYLKRFHARSKLILVLTDFSYEIQDEKKYKEALSPFLKYKIIYASNKEIRK